MVFCDKVSYNSGQPETTLVAEDDPELLNLGLQALPPCLASSFLERWAGMGGRGLGFFVQP